MNTLVSRAIIWWAPALGGTLGFVLVLRNNAALGRVKWGGAIVDSFVIYCHCDVLCFFRVAVWCQARGGL